MSKPSNKICPRCGKGGYVNYIGQSNIYEAKCYNCGYYFVFGELDLYEEREPITNADRIRAMSDEGLAEFLETLCPSYNWTLALKGMAWLDWLRQEVSE